jgi:hypothetical protein
LIFARLTPGYNFTWANNGTEPVDPPVATKPHVLDFTGLEKLITEIGLPSDTSDQGLERYMNEKLAMAFDL